MENNQNIPNVSVVFRQLVQLSHTNPRLNKINQQEYGGRSPNFNFDNSPNQNNYRNDFVSNMGLDDRQQRHQQLMNRFKSFLQQNKQLFGTSLNDSYDNKYLPSTKQRNFYNQNQFSQTQYNPNSLHSNKNQYENTFSNNNQRKWIPPKIKYRHLEDFKQEKQEQQQHNSKFQANTRTEPSFYKSNLPQHLQEQLRLKQQFYQNSKPNKQQKATNQLNQKQANNISRQSKSTTNQPQQQIFQQQQTNSQQQNFNKYSHLSQKQTNYGQNLQSYWQICRKPIKNKLIEEKNKNQNVNKSMNSDKFLRKQGGKVEGINLQKAMRILALED